MKTIKVVDNTCLNNEVTIEELDKNLRATVKMASDNEQKLDELSRKLGVQEAELKRAEERARLEDEINNKKNEVEDIVAEVKRKEDENRQLQEEMDDARKRQEEASQALIAATTTPKHHHLQDIDDDDDEERMTNGDFSQDLTNDEDDLRDPVDERLTLAEKSEGRLGQHQRRSARDYNGQDPPRECQARKGQVQDTEGSEERQHQEEGGSV